MNSGSEWSAPDRLDRVMLSGRFVRLEPLEATHEDQFVRAALRDPRIWDFLRHRVTNESEAVRTLREALIEASDGLNLPFAVIDCVSNRLVGSTRLLDYRPADRGIEIGSTWYVPEVQGSAVNPEAKLLLLSHAFEVLRCLRVQLKTDERNLRSRAAILKLGARQEGILRKHMIVQGGILRNSVYFSILDDEWPAVKSNLEARLAGFAEN
jgi:RimJ/RimL family protein N-acetyltransferase